MHRTRKLVSNLDLEIIFETSSRFVNYSLFDFLFSLPPLIFHTFFFYLFCVVRSLLRIISIFHFFLFFISVS